MLENANGKWTYASHRLAGLALILLFIEVASKQGFPGRILASCREIPF
jgi:hypothetical protein